MKIYFKLDSLDSDENKLIPEFCRMLVSEITNDIINNLPDQQLYLREKAILNVKWISWRIKPKRLNMHRLGVLIAKSIVCNKVKDTYCIEISKTKILPYSNTPLHMVARYLDYGSIGIKPTWFITTTFMKYRININNYWKSFISLRLGQLTIDECVIIE